MGSVKAVDDAMYRFVASLTGYDNDSTPGGPGLSTVQKVVADLPEGHGGPGKINHTDRVSHGAYASGIASSIALARGTSEPALVRLCETTLVSQCTRVPVQKRRSNTVAVFYLAARQGRQQLVSGDRLLPADPPKLVTKTAAFKDTTKQAKQAGRSAQAATLFGRITAPMHSSKVRWLRSQAKHIDALSQNDRQCIITWEGRTQLSAKGGSCKFFSVPPVTRYVRVAGFEYRFAVTNVLGNESKALHSTAQGARCPKCPGRPRVKGGRHFHNCILCGRSAVHNAVRDATVRVTIHLVPDLKTQTTWAATKMGNLVVRPSFPVL